MTNSPETQVLIAGGGPAGADRWPCCSPTMAYRPCSSSHDGMPSPHPRARGRAQPGRWRSCATLAAGRATCAPKRWRSGQACDVASNPGQPARTRPAARFVQWPMTSPMRGTGHRPGLLRADPAPARGGVTGTRCWPRAGTRSGAARSRPTVIAPGSPRTVSRRRSSTRTEPSGPPEIIARYLVAADGVRSPIRERLGITFDGVADLGRQRGIGFRADLSRWTGRRRRRRDVCHRRDRPG